jgi:hypothetical protein
MKDVFPDLLLFAKIVLTVLMHLLAQSGSSFSIMKRVKTYPRSETLLSVGLRARIET